MPSVADIMNVAAALEKSPIMVVRGNCVAVRNRNATCRRCMNVCEAGALDVCGNELTLDASLCTSCGACAAACPTEALVSVAPTDLDIELALTSSIDAAEGRAVFACARIASKRQANPAAYVEVPCLSRVGEAQLLSAIAFKARSVLLVDGDCSTCKYHDYVCHADAALAYAAELLSVQGNDAPMERVTGFPADMQMETADGLFGTTRRGFFSEAVGAARDTAMTAARVTVAQELGLDAAEPSMGERLRVTDAGTLPLVRVPRHETLINALYSLGEPQAESLDSRLFGSVTVDSQKCNACGMCVMFCPTGALRRDPDDDVGDPLRYIEFSASDCVQCGLCADVCWKSALKLNTQVDMAQLFDFEPATFKLNPPKRSPSYFG